MLPEVTSEIEAILDAVFDGLPILMPHVEDITEVEPGTPGYAWVSEHGRIHVGVLPDGDVVYDWAIPSFGTSRAWGPRDRSDIAIDFIVAAEAYADAAHDPWDTDAEYGYADYRLVGTDTWEDETGIAELRARLEIPDAWFLVKVVNFHDACPTGDGRRSLRTIETWLAENCEHAYRRIGWSSGCSTKVGVAFENQNEAFIFHLRWR